MQHPVAIEDIEGMRRLQGIEDVELREQIQQLRVGDFVRLTFLGNSELPAAETLLVRITRIRGFAFRGKLAGRPASKGLARLRAELPVAFTTAHIHSVRKG